MITVLHKYQKQIVLFIFALSAFYALIYTYLAATPFVRADGWRYMDIYLIPLWNGTFEWKMLWNDIHPYPLSAFLYILNAKYLGLNMMYEAVFGIVFKVGFVGLLLYLYSNSVKNTNLFYFLPILFIIFSFNSTAEYTWSLVSLVNVDFFMMILSAAIANNILRQEEKSYRLLIYFFITYAIAMICDYDTNLIFSVALISTLIYISIVAHKIRAKALVLLSIMFFILFVFKLFLTFFIQYKETTLIPHFDVLFDLTFVIVSFVQSIGASIFDFESLHKNIINRDSLTYFSYPLALLWLGSIMVYIKNKMYNITIVPLMMILFHLFLIGAIILYRPTEITAPRYTSMYQIGMVGAIWVYALYFIHHTQLRSIFVALIVLFSVIQLLYIPKGWNYHNSLDNLTHQHIENLYRVGTQHSTQAIQLNQGLIGNYFSISKLNLIKEKQLNIYSKSMYEKFHGERNE